MQDPNFDPEHGQDLWQHWSELKKRLIYAISSFLIAVAISYHFAADIYQFLLRPLIHAYAGHSHRLIYTGLAEGFLTHLKLALFTGIIASFPIIASQIYIFIAPGLYRNEKMVLLPYLICSPLLFCLGGLMVYYFIFPAAWKFFISFEAPASATTIAIALEARVSEYLSLSMHLIIAFGLAFQLPILLTLLARIGIVTASDLMKRRKYAIVIIFAIAAIITPPDAISQIGLAIPMLLLYEISIIACKFIEAKRA